MSKFQKGNKYRFQNKLTPEQFEEIKQMIRETINYNRMTNKIEGWGVSRLTAYRAIDRAAKEVGLDTQDK